MKQKIAMLCGGVGGARAALALSENYANVDLTFVVNTGDDFTHLGLEIWPDWDTVVYHLAGIQEAQRGWGRADEGTRVMDELKRLGGEDWFHLGDRDLALHLHRSQALAQGLAREIIAKDVCEKWSIRSAVLPLTQGSTHTQLLLQDGRKMDFQQWFVREQGQAKVAQIVSAAPQDLPLTVGVEQALRECSLVLMAPSNPYLSLGPMLAQKKLADLLKELRVPKIAVSPLIAGKAVKGPLDSLIESLSAYSGQEAMADYWKDWVDILVMPEDEANHLNRDGLQILGCPSWLKTEIERESFVTRLLEIWRSKL